MLRALALRPRSHVVPKNINRRFLHITSSHRFPLSQKNATPGRPIHCRAFSSCHPRLGILGSLFSRKADEADIPAEKLLDLLERAAYSPDLYERIPDETLKERLEYCHYLFNFIRLYVYRPLNVLDPKDTREHDRRLEAFQDARVPAGSEVDRARRAVREIVRAAVHHVGPVPDARGPGLTWEESVILMNWEDLLEAYDDYLADWNEDTRALDPSSRPRDLEGQDLKRWSGLWFNAHRPMMELWRRCGGPEFSYEPSEVWGAKK